MRDNIYQESLDSSVTCTYELKLKKMSAKEICYFQKKTMSLEVSFKFIFKMHKTPQKYIMKYSSSFSSFKTLTTSLRVFVS